MAFIQTDGYSHFTTGAIAASEAVTSTPATALLRQCKLNSDSAPSGIVLLDNACGCATVTKQLFKLLQPSPPQDMQIICGDLDLTMVEGTQKIIETRGWSNQVRCEKLDSHNTPFEDAKFTHVLMNFGPQLMKDAQQMLKDSYRITKTGGIFGFTTWTKPGFIPSIMTVFPDFKPGATPVAGEWRDAQNMTGILTAVGFHDVEVKPVDFETNEEDIDGYIELMSDFLMAKFLQQGDNKEKYAQYMRQPGKMKMAWQALIVTARK